MNNQNKITMYILCLLFISGCTIGNISKAECLSERFHQSNRTIAKQLNNNFYRDIVTSTTPPCWNNNKFDSALVISLTGSFLDTIVGYSIQMSGETVSVQPYAISYDSLRNQYCNDFEMIKSDSSIISLTSSIWNYEERTLETSYLIFDGYQGRFSRIIDGSSSNSYFSFSNPRKDGEPKLHSLIMKLSHWIAQSHPNSIHNQLVREYIRGN